MTSPFRSLVAIAMPKAPTPAISQLNNALNGALKKPDRVEELRYIGAQPMPGSPEVFGKFTVAERARWIPLAKSLGVKVD